ncbi:hypothetical protein GCM10018980_32460 [Streptomyces capoamus]|uniref:Uncharacterized protein n=1 Tax=Streptomyces capoamus TaxID=68183 RepID=A0A919EW16_9ACTN|nr:hypothetical protein GCM10010501_39130 [Streptomyces libani subsp. rufus]GHG50464.1 hypothetical protein GCM10018980_32460 [Streptomyces capoamus]
MGSTKPASRSGSSSISVPNGSPASRIPAAVGGRRPSPTRTGRKPLTWLKACRSCTSGCDRGCRATAAFPVRAAQQRRATCWAMVPVGKNAAASVPSSAATRSSRAVTIPSP